mmetsp:Transcript_21273/g.75661  ORF Transcript_21273/g.75661 Transcript_21273/m.75661 type:complete len:288 (-) Transcript_21273:239-1102(-)
MWATSSNRRASTFCIVKCFSCTPATTTASTAPLPSSCRMRPRRTVAAPPTASVANDSNSCRALRSISPRHCDMAATRSATLRPTAPQSCASVDTMAAASKTASTGVAGPLDAGARGEAPPRVADAAANVLALRSADDGEPAPCASEPWKAPWTSAPRVPFAPRSACMASAATSSCLSSMEASAAQRLQCCDVWTKSDSEVERKRRESCSANACEASKRSFACSASSPRGISIDGSVGAVGSAAGSAGGPRTRRPHLNASSPNETAKPGIGVSAFGARGFGGKGRLCS